MAIINTINTIVTGTTTDDLIYSIVDPYIAGSGGNQTLYGQTGNDTYIISNATAVTGDVVVELFGEGTDTAVLYTGSSGTYVMTSNVENAIVRRYTPANASGSTVNTLNGNELNNVITVEDGPFGAAGVGEILDGGLGNDTMNAGHGNDTYYVDSATDVIIESNTAIINGVVVNGFANGVVQGGFVDNVYATVSYVLGINVENLTLSGSANIEGKGNLLPNTLTGNTGNNVLDGQDGNDMLLGNAGNDRLLGGGGNDLLDGGTGNDSMDGGAGDDTYRMDSVLDTIVDAGGIDTVQWTNSATFNSWVLPTSIENVFALTANNVTLTGNALDNQLFGGGGNDILIGGDGNDILDGGLGIDTLNGGKGNDVYVLDSASDVIVAEKAAEGIDTVFVTLTVGQTYTLAAQMERLYLTGTANTNGTGNALDNVLVGNDTGNNILLGQAGNDNIRGLSGNDTLSGGLGNDILTGDAGNDSLAGDAGNDQLFGGAGTDILDAGAGNDILDGGAGVDNMAGGAGNDIYFVDIATLGNPNTRDIVYELAGPTGGIDLVNSSVSINELFANVENLTLTGLANIDGIGNALTNIINGNAGDNMLDAGRDLLADTLIGGLGNDTYIIYGTNDIVTEVPNLLVPAPGSGLQPGFTDTVIYRGTTPYTLANNVENLALDTGLGNVNATGNTFDNYIAGSSGNNTLDGGAGNDTIMGGDGTDTLLGGAGNDKLDGNLGADTMAGGAGDDMYTVESISDIVNEVLSGGAGNDTVVSFLHEININTSGTMQGTIENVTLGGGALNAVGNDLANILRGNALSNVLEGRKGNDTYYADLTDQIKELSDAAVNGTDTVNLDIGSNALSVAVRIGTAPAPLIPRGQLWNVENVTLLGTGNSNIMFEHSTLSATQANTLVGNDGNNILDGAGGADSMTGGKGGDTYYVDNAGDKTVELLDQGNDTVFSTVTWTLQADTENLNLIGPGNLAGTGNALDNMLRGNDLDNVLTGLAGNDTLRGGGGNDTMNGGDGDDTYDVGSIGDIVVDSSGVDIVFSYISGPTAYNLATGVENLTFYNGYALTPAVMKGNGNALDNRITANLSANTIDGGAGNDTLDFNIIGSLTTADILIGGAGNDTVSNDTLLADISGTTAPNNLTLTNMSAIETAVLRADGAQTGSIDFGATGWASLKEVDFTGSTGKTLTVNGAPNSGFVNNLGAGTPLVFGLVDFNGNGVNISGVTSGSADVLNLAIRDSGLNTALTTAGWETIRINNQPAADGSFAANALDMANLTVSGNKTVLEVTGMGGSQLNLTGLKTADLTGGSAFNRNLQVTVVNYDGRLQLTQSGGANPAQVNVQDSSFWLDTVTINQLEIFAKGPAGAALTSTSLVHLNEGGTNITAVYLDGAANSTLTVDGIRAATINASAFTGANLFVTAEGTTAGFWTGPDNGAVNFVFTGGGGNDSFNFNIAGSVDGMDQVFGGGGTDTVNVNITGMGVSGTAMSGGLHFEDTETINFANTGTAVVDASMMDGNVNMASSAFTATTIHGLAGNFNGGNFNGNVTIYADPAAGTATYSNFGAGTQILYGSQAQGVANTFTFGTRLDDTDFVQGWDFDTGTPDSLTATLGGGVITPQIQGVENLTFAVSGGNTINAGLIVGAVNWTFTGSQALTLNGFSGVSPMNGATGMIITATGLSGLFTLDGSDSAETITLGSGGSFVQAWGGDDTITGGNGIDQIYGEGGNDTITGGNGADELYGGDGTDIFNIAAADGVVDTVSGGAGTHDTLDYSSLGTAVTVNLLAGTASAAGTGTDLVLDIDRVWGSSVADNFTGAHNYTLTNSGSDVWRNYDGRGGNDIISGGGSEAGYSDYVEFGGTSNGVFVNLGAGSVTVNGQLVAAGRATDIGGSSIGTDTLTDIDGAIGTNFADILVGGSTSLAYNGTLYELWNGWGGNDIIAGNAAALSPTLSPDGFGQVNILDYDMVNYQYATSGVRVHLGLGTAQDGLGGSDLLFDINMVRGSFFDDMLIGGNAQNDYFESFEGRQGDDYINGGSGYDSARYQNAAAGINANLVTGIVLDGDGGTDVLLSIEHIRGSDFDDIMLGSANNDVFEGRAGTDSIDGGAGFDRVEFTNAIAGVTVDLSLGSLQVVDDGWGNDETLVGIESVRGSIHDDFLTGGAGNDFFDGRGGIDTIDGGGGIDTVSYQGATGVVSVNLAGLVGGADGADLLSNIENIIGSFYDDSLTGDAGNNRIEGAGNKSWTFANTGTDDSDTLSGGGGNDTFVFNSALDASNNLDTITDFNVSGPDKIELDDAIFAGLLVGALNPLNFVLGAGALDTADRIIYDSGALYYDADGLGGVAQVQFALLSGAPTLAASDFIIA